MTRARCLALLRRSNRRSLSFVRRALASLVGGRLFLAGRPRRPPRAALAVHARAVGLSDHKPNAHGFPSRRGVGGPSYGKYIVVGEMGGNWLSVIREQVRPLVGWWLRRSGCVRSV
jgi:hypothetical protein